MGVHIPQGKTSKTFTKRFKVTRRGKVLARKAGQNHFNAKASRKSQLSQKRLQQVVLSKKELLKYVPK